MSSEGQSRRPSLVLILLLRSGWEAQVPGQPCGELRDRTPAQSSGKATPTHAFPVGGRLAGRLAQCPSGCTGSSSVPRWPGVDQVPWPSAGRGSLPVSHPGALGARVLGGRNQVAPAVTVHCPHLRLCVTPGLVVSPKGQAWGKARRLDDGAQTRGSDPASGGAASWWKEPALERDLHSRRARLVADGRGDPLGSVPHPCHVDSGWGLRGVEWLPSVCPHSETAPRCNEIQQQPGSDAPQLGWRRWAVTRPACRRSRSWGVGVPPDGQLRACGEEPCVPCEGPPGL